jgi:hypothetical protein
MQQDNTSPAPTLMSHVIRWGLIMAACSILITVSLYVINEGWMVQLKVLFISLAIYLGLTIYAGIDYRKLKGGFLSYGNAFVHGFLIMALSALISTCFNAVLYHVIDTELAQRLTETAMENQREMMIGFGAPEDQIDQALEDARERTENQFTISGMAFGYIFILIFSAIMALISALFVRKNEPLEM